MAEGKDRGERGLQVAPPNSAAAPDVVPLASGKHPLSAPTLESRSLRLETLLSAERRVSPPSVLHHHVRSGRTHSAKMNQAEWPCREARFRWPPVCAAVTMPSSP